MTTTFGKLAHALLSNLIRQHQWELHALEEENKRLWTRLQEALTEDDLRRFKNQQPAPRDSLASIPDFSASELDFSAVGGTDPVVVSDLTTPSIDVRTASPMPVLMVTAPSDARVDSGSAGGSENAPLRFGTPMPPPNFVIPVQQIQVMPPANQSGAGGGQDGSAHRMATPMPQSDIASGMATPVPLALGSASPLPTFVVTGPDGNKVDPNSLQMHVLRVSTPMPPAPTADSDGVSAGLGNAAMVLVTAPPEDGAGSRAIGSQGGDGTQAASSGADQQWFMRVSTPMPNIQIATPVPSIQVVPIQSAAGGSQAGGGGDSTAKPPAQSTNVSAAPELPGYIGSPRTSQVAPAGFMMPTISAPQAQSSAQGFSSVIPIAVGSGMASPLPGIFVAGPDGAPVNPWAAQGAAMRISTPMPPGSGAASPLPGIVVAGPDGAVVDPFAFSVQSTGMRISTPMPGPQPGSQDEELHAKIQTPMPADGDTLSAFLEDQKQDAVNSLSNQQSTRRKHSVDAASVDSLESKVSAAMSTLPCPKTAADIFGGGPKRDKSRPHSVASQAVSRPMSVATHGFNAEQGENLTRSISYPPDDGTVVHEIEYGTRTSDARASDASWSPHGPCEHRLSMDSIVSQDLVPEPKRLPMPPSGNGIGVKQPPGVVVSEVATAVNSMAASVRSSVQHGTDPDLTQVVPIGHTGTLPTQTTGTIPELHLTQVVPTAHHSTTLDLGPWSPPAHRTETLELGKVNSNHHFKVSDTIGSMDSVQNMHAKDSGSRSRQGSLTGSHSMALVAEASVRKISVHAAAKSGWCDDNVTQEVASKLGAVDLTTTKFEVHSFWSFSDVEALVARRTFEELVNEARPVLGRSQKALTRELTKRIHHEDDHDPSMRNCMHCRVPLHPDGQTRVVWEIFCLTLISYDFVVLPLNFIDITVFNSGFFYVCGWVSRVAWTIDLFLSFLTGQFHLGMVEMRAAKVAKLYIKSWCLFDIALVLISWAILEEEGKSSSGGASTSAFRSLRLVRFLRLLRLLKVDMMLRDILERFNSNYLILCSTLVKYIVALTVINHIIACIWYHVGAGSDQGWVTMWNIQSKTFGYRYFTSIHWSLAQFTGSIEIAPVSLSERITAVIVLLLAIIVFSSFISTLSNTMLALQNLQSEKFFQQRILRKYLYENDISTSLSVRVKEYLRGNHLQEQKDDQVNKALESLPDELLKDMMNEIRSPILSGHKFFCDLSITFPRLVRQLCHEAIDGVRVLRAESIFTCGDACNRIFFVCRGAVKYFVKRAAQSGIGSVEDDDSGPSEEYDTPFEGGRMLTKPVDFNPVLTRGMWLSEAAMWTRWEHCGDLIGVRPGNVFTMEAATFADKVSQYANAYTATKRYALCFVDLMNSGVNCTDVMELEMPKESRPSSSSAWSGKYSQQSSWQRGSKIKIVVQEAMSRLTVASGRADRASTNSMDSRRTLKSRGGRLLGHKSAMRGVFQEGDRNSERDRKVRFSNGTDSADKVNSLDTPEPPPTRTSKVSFAE